MSTKTRILVLTCLALAGNAAFGQTLGSIDGEARDGTGAAVSGVTVTVTNQGTNASRAAITNEAGAYSFPSLAPGTYEHVAVSAGNARSSAAGRHVGSQRRHGPRG